MKKLLTILICTLTAAHADVIFNYTGTDGQPREKIVPIVPGTIFGSGTGGVTYYTPSAEFAFSGSTISLSGTQPGNHTWSGVNNFTGTFQINGIALGTAAFVGTGTGSTQVPLNSQLGSLAYQNGTFSGSHSGTSSGVNTGNQTITLTGDVVGSGTGSFATTVVQSSTSTAGKIALATSAEAQAGSDTGKAVVSSVLFTWWTWLRTQVWIWSGAQSYTGNVTIGDSSADSLSVPATTTHSGPVSASGQPSAWNVAANDVMTRSLVDDQPVWQPWTTRVQFVNMLSGFTGTGGAVNTARPGWVGLGFANGSTAGTETGYLCVYRELGTNSGSGAGTRWGGSEYLVSFNVSRQAPGFYPGLVYRILVGVPATHATDLSARGVGVLFGFSATSNTVALQVHDGTTLVTGSAVPVAQVPDRESYTLRVASGTAYLYGASGFGRPTSILSTVAGAPTANGSSSHDSVVMNFSSTNGLSVPSSTLRLSDIVIRIK